MVGRILAVVVSGISLVITVSQFTRPAVLRRREKWLRDAIESESDPQRLAYLEPHLIRVTARIVGVLEVSGWRFVSLSAQMLIGPAQILIWRLGEPDIEGAVSVLLFSLVIVATAIRRGIRLLAERARVTFAYENGLEVKPARVGLLDTMEGGTRLEFVLAIMFSLGITALSIGAAVIYLGNLVLGFVMLGLGATLVLIMTILVRRYVVNRRETYGPWSVSDPHP